MRWYWWLVIVIVAVLLLFLASCMLFKPPGASWYEHIKIRAYSHWFLFSSLWTKRSESDKERVWASLIGYTTYEIAVEDGKVKVWMPLSSMYSQESPESIEIEFTDAAGKTTDHSVSPRELKLIRHRGWFADSPKIVLKSTSGSTDQYWQHDGPEELAELEGSSVGRYVSVGEQLATGRNMTLNDWKNMVGGAGDSLGEVVSSFEPDNAQMGIY
jgi:hypothetical protein